MAKQKEKTYCTTGEGRVMFVNAAEPRPVVKGGKAVYSVTITLDPESAEYKDLRQQLLAVAKEAFPDTDIPAAIKAGEFHWPLKPGAKARAEAEKKGYSGNHYDGTVVFQARSDFAPGVVLTSDRDTRLSPDQIKAQVYPGCYVYLHGELAAGEGVAGGKPWVKMYLQNIMKSRDGDRLGGGQSLQEAFAGIEGRELDAAGEAFEDDEIPF